MAKCDLVCADLKMMNKLVPNVLLNQYFPLPVDLLHWSD